MFHILLRKDKSTRIFYTFVTKKDMNIIIIGATSGIGYGLLKNMQYRGIRLEYLGVEELFLKSWKKAIRQKS